MLRGGEENSVLSSLSAWSPHWGSKDAQVVSFKQLRDQQGVDKLPGTQGAWIEHICTVLMSRLIWHHNMALNLTCLDPLGVEISRPKARPGVSVRNQSVREGYHA